MTDLPETPVQQAPAPVQQANQTDWENRYKGASQVINQQANRIKELEAQLSSAASDNEQLRSSLGIKDVEKDTAVNSYKTQLEAALSEKATTAAELNRLKALEAKLKTARELGATHLFPLLDSIPYVDNPDAQKEIMKTFVDWGDSLVKDREKQLTAGLTPSSPSIPSSPSLPTSNKDWEEYVNSKPFGPEREQAYEQWWKFGASQTK